VKLETWGDRKDLEWITKWKLLDIRHLGGKFVFHSNVLGSPFCSLIVTQSINLTRFVGTRIAHQFWKQTLSISWRTFQESVDITLPTLNFEQFFWHYGLIINLFISFFTSHSIVSDIYLIIMLIYKISLSLYFFKHIKDIINTDMIC